MPIVRKISDSDHLAYIGSRPSVSFLQTPAWGKVKSDWRSESVGWFDTPGDTEVRGAGLVLYRKVPRVRRYLAYLPEGPDLPWAKLAEAGELERWLEALREYLASRGAFAIRLGPTAVARRWSAATVKAALADASVDHLGAVPPDTEDPAVLAVGEVLADQGWQPPTLATGFAVGQPQHVFWVDLAERTEAELMAGFNQLWRRNIRRAEREGVSVERGTTADLPEFHSLYVETAARDGFAPRPLSYFEQMFAAMQSEAPERLALYLARHEGDLVAATTMTRVGEHAWYSYGASSTAKRDVRGSNAVQWQMMRDARGAGCRRYDLRGITDTLSASDPHVGLLQFKVGTGGEAVEYLGEWTLPVNPLLYRAFEFYLSRRGSSSA